MALKLHLCTPEYGGSILAGGQRLLERWERAVHAQSAVSRSCDAVRIALVRAQVWWAQSPSMPHAAGEEGEIAARRGVGLVRGAASRNGARLQLAPERTAAGSRDELLGGDIEVPGEEAWRSQRSVHCWHHGSPLDGPAQRGQVVQVPDTCLLDLAGRMEVHGAEDRHLSVQLSPHKHRHVMARRGGASSRGDIQCSVLFADRTEATGGIQEEGRGGVDPDPSAVNVRAPFDEVCREVRTQSSSQQGIDLLHGDHIVAAGPLFNFKR
mmetsp:Transcript_60602/g.180474  ORF Transcript_60602/g.180474 Transcript_60602/m.180474 type:complete len:267 (+) Transcript_60602:454-1254(+)